jgi:hypothetical protein
MRSKGRISKAFVLGAVAALVALSAPTLAGAIVIIDGFGMVGIVDGQTARLNVVNVSTQLPPGPCMVALMVMDSMGMVLARTTLDLTPGHAAFHDFSFDDVVGPRPTGRLQIRGEVRALGNRRACRNLVPTLEVFDNDSMKTMFLLGLTPVFQQPPDPD